MGPQSRPESEGLQLYHDSSALQVNYSDQDTHKEFVPHQPPQEQYKYEYPAPILGAPGPETKPRVCGVRRRVLIAAIVALLVVAGVVGGVAGGLTHRKKGQTQSSSSSSSSSPSSSPSGNNTGSSPIASDSKLSSIAWTDTNGLMHQRLYYQDTKNSIRESAWNSSGKAWYLSPSVVTSAKKGTAIAATVTGPPDWPFQVKVYTIDSTGYIRERNSNSDNDWSDGPLNAQNIRASDKSSLSAVWHRHTNCPLCPNTHLLIYQNQTSKWNLGNETSSGWVWSSLPANPISGSPSALSVYSQAANAPAQLRFWYLFPKKDDGNNYACGLDWAFPAPDSLAAANGNWQNRETACLSGTSVPSGGSITAFTYGTSNNSLPLLMNILNTGTQAGISNQPWFGAKGGLWGDIQTPFVMSSVDALSPLASNTEAHVFAFVKGQVNEFVVAPDGITWSLVGRVTT